jgi:tRNA A37 threonylcarbamoyladenosine dehydratase
LGARTSGGGLQTSRRFPAGRRERETIRRAPTCLRTGFIKAYHRQRGVFLLSVKNAPSLHRGQQPFSLPAGPQSGFPRERINGSAGLLAVRLPPLSIKREAPVEQLFFIVRQSYPERKGKMEENWLSRTALLIGEEGISRLHTARVALLGLGGVGGACAEALCRAGIGQLLLCDNDTVSRTNLNRQLAATCETIGRPKVQVMAQRLLSICPSLSLTLCEQFYLPENSDFLYAFHPDIVIDAIDTVTAKLHLAQECDKRGIPLISCLGTGNRLSPQELTLGDIAETAGCGCPLARVMRRELKKRGVRRLRVVFSREKPLSCTTAGEPGGRHPPGSISFVPPVAGYLLAGEAVRLLLSSPAGSE